LSIRSLLIATTLASGLLTVIAGRNIFEIAPHTIGDTKVVTTIAGGKIVYEADAK
jgi:predicted amidohydrolase YtcJ